MPADKGQGHACRAKCVCGRSTALGGRGRVGSIDVVIPVFACTEESMAPTILPSFASPLCLTPLTARRFPS